MPDGQGRFGNTPASFELERQLDEYPMCSAPISRILTNYSKCIKAIGSIEDKGAKSHVLMAFYVSKCNMINQGKYPEYIKTLTLNVMAVRYRIELNKIKGN